MFVPCRASSAPSSVTDALASVVVVVTAFRPDGGFSSRYADLAAACGAIVVVDNTPDGHDFGALAPPFRILQDGRNKGLGPALNIGIDEAVALGATHVALFDQDSHPTTELISRLLDGISRAGSRAVVGPVHVDDSTGRAADVRAKPSPSGLRPLSCLPTSGMLLPAEGWKSGPRFSDSLFLDLVDFDWCWRRGAEGWRHFQFATARMPHRLGLAQRRWMGMTFHVPSPYRHYFQFRDTLRLAPREHVPWYPRLRLLCILPLKLLVYPWLMDRGTERLGWMLRGIRDAIRSRDGIGAAGEALGS